MFKILPKWEDLEESEKNIYREKVKNLVNKLNDIQFDEFTILTGSNGSGKSLIRGQIGLRYNKDENNINKRKVKSISMELRTSTNAEWGALSSAMLDNEWSPTSVNTLHLIEGILKAAGIRDKPETGCIKTLSDTGYIVIDEPEIGMSEESQLAFTFEFIKILPKLRDEKIGILMITHSRIILDAFHCYMSGFDIENVLTLNEWLEECPKAKFINLDNLSFDEYLNRLIKPADLSLLNANYLFHAIHERMYKEKK